MERKRRATSPKIYCNPATKNPEWFEVKLLLTKNLRCLAQARIVSNELHSILLGQKRPLCHVPFAMCHSQKRLSTSNQKHRLLCSRHLSQQNKTMNRYQTSSNMLCFKSLAEHIDAPLQVMTLSLTQNHTEALSLLSRYVVSKPQVLPPAFVVGAAEDTAEWSCWQRGSGQQYSKW